MADRVPIPDDLAARVLFASDRTCCVCRTPGKVSQIHHIDEDRSRNVWENLAVLCLECHAMTHATIPFGRGLNADQIRLYNESWRDLVRDRLLPESSGPVREYLREVLLEIIMADHYWVQPYYQLAGVWKGHLLDALRDTQVEYSPTEYERWRQFFTVALPAVPKRIESILASHGAIVPIEVKLAAIRLGRALGNVHASYALLQRLPVDDDRQSSFNQLFGNAATALRTFSDVVQSAMRSLNRPDPAAG